MVVDTDSSSNRASQETAQTPRVQREDALSYLPCSAITEYQKGDVIYELDKPSPGLHLVLEGFVKVSRMSGNNEIVMNLCQADDFFGELAFVQVPGERAVALAPTKLMSWSEETIRDIILRDPELGIALMQLLVHRCLDLGMRVATLSVDATRPRLAKALCHLAERLGEPDPQSENLKRLAPYSHKLLAQMIGTTREAVTHCMNQFRRQGLIVYSRRGMVVNSEAINRWIDSQSKHDSAVA